METSAQISIIIKYIIIICLSVAFIDSVYRTNKNYYHQMFLEECKFAVKEKKMPEYITDDIEISYNDSDWEDSDEENHVEENSNEEKFNK